jgi:hypothetical protein
MKHSMCSRSSMTGKAMSRVVSAAIDQFPFATGVDCRRFRDRNFARNFKNRLDICFRQTRLSPRQFHGVWETSIKLLYIASVC